MINTRLSKTDKFFRYWPKGVKQPNAWGTLCHLGRLPEPSGLVLSGYSSSDERSLDSPASAVTTFQRLGYVYSELRKSDSQGGNAKELAKLI